MEEKKREKGKRWREKLGDPERDRVTRMRERRKGRRQMRKQTEGWERDGGRRGLKNN